MKRWALVVLLAACGGKHDAKREAECAAFADRVVACAFDTSITPPMSADEQKNVRHSAEAACTKSTDDPATLHYYGDVDRKIACMQGKDCAGVRACLTADDARGAK